MPIFWSSWSSCHLGKGFLSKSAVPPGVGHFGGWRHQMLSIPPRAFSMGSERPSTPPSPKLHGLGMTERDASTRHLQGSGRHKGTDATIASSETNSVLSPHKIASLPPSPPPSPSPTPRPRHAST